MKSPLKGFIPSMGGANLGEYKIETAGMGCRAANRTLKSATQQKLIVALQLGSKKMNTKLIK